MLVSIELPEKSRISKFAFVDQKSMTKIIVIIIFPEFPL